MFSWIALVVTITLIVLVPVNIYLATRLHKINYLKEMKNKKLSWLISYTPLYITLILLIWNATNANIIILHYFFIVLLGHFIYSIVCLCKRKIELKNGREITFIICTIVTVLYLGYGYYVAHHIVETHYDVIATKDIGVDKFRIAQITDSHVGATMNGDTFYNYMLKINDTNPDIVVVTGDYIDDETSYEDMVKSCSGLGALKTKYGVYYVYGNHDKGYFNRRNYGDKELREELTKNNVIILEDEGIDIPDTNIYLYGRQDRTVKDRKQAEEITKDIDLNKYIIVLNHQPNDYDNESNAKIDLVLSGHTHGGQVFPLQIIDGMFGMNNQIYGIETRDKTTFIVSSGIGDWEVKFKTGTKAEYVIIDITNK